MLDRWISKTRHCCPRERNRLAPKYTVHICSHLVFTVFTNTRCTWRQSCFLQELCHSHESERNLGSFPGADRTSRHWAGLGWLLKCKPLKTAHLFWSPHVKSPWISLNLMKPSLGICSWKASVLPKIVKQILLPKRNQRRRQATFSLGLMMKQFPHPMAMGSVLAIRKCSIDRSDQNRSFQSHIHKTM